MLNSRKKNCALHDKKINILTLVSEKKILNETKNHNPPCKLNGRSLTTSIHWPCCGICSPFLCCSSFYYFVCGLFEWICCTVLLLFYSWWFNYQRESWDPINQFKPTMFVYVPSQSLNFTCHLLWSICMWNDLRWLFILLILVALLTITV